MATLFETEEWLLTFEAGELAVLQRPIEGDGGHQRLLREVLQTMGRKNALVMDDTELLKVHRYAEAYGDGGYQDRFKVIRSAAWRAGWVQP